jgi:hypothetical protein
MKNFNCFKYILLFQSNTFNSTVYSNQIFEILYFEILLPRTDICFCFDFDVNPGRKSYNRAPGNQRYGWWVAMRILKMVVFSDGITDCPVTFADQIADEIRFGDDRECQTPLDI